MRVLGRCFPGLVVLIFLTFASATSAAQSPPLRFAKPIPYNGAYGDWIAAADLNGDGQVDLVTISNTEDQVGVVLGKGDGTFRREVKYPSGGNVPISLAITDVNSDGKPDLVVLHSHPGTGVVSVLRGNGDGTFQTAVTYPTGNSSGSSGLAVGDMNGDTYPDIVVMSAPCPALCDVQFGLCGCVDTLYNNRDGTFGAGMFSLSGGYSLNSISITNGFLISTNSCMDPYCDTVRGTVCCGGICHDSGGEDPFSPAATGDLNGDGNFDLAVANYSGGNVGVLLGTGNNNFQHVVTYPVNRPYYVAIGDLNGDGKDDLVVTNGTQNTGVLLGNGDGTVQPMVNFGGVGSVVLVLADVNGDGKLDVIGTDAIMLNTSGFSTTTQVTSSMNPSFVHQSVTFTATVTSTHGPIPDGELVKFYSGTALLASVPLSRGVATYTTSTLSAEIHNIKAKYPGDKTLESSMGKLQQLVQ